MSIFIKMWKVVTRFYDENPVNNSIVFAEMDYPWPMSYVPDLQETSIMRALRRSKLTHRVATIRWTNAEEFTAPEVGTVLLIENLDCNVYFLAEFQLHNNHFFKVQLCGTGERIYIGKSQFRVAGVVTFSKKLF